MSVHKMVKFMPKMVLHYLQKSNIYKVFIIANNT